MNWWWNACLSSRYASAPINVAKVDFQTHCRRMTSRFRRESPSRTPSLIATLFGDVVEAHGGEISLGSLIRLTIPLGANERLVRTSVYRLAQDDWVVGTKQGRRSYYRLTNSAHARVCLFDRRIYYFRRQKWNGYWRLLFTGTQGIAAEKRAELRRRLTWLGFGVIAPNVYGHPTAPLELVWKLFSELGVSDRVVVMKAANYDRLHGLGTREMVRQCFKIGDLESEYLQFIQQYTPLAEALGNSDTAGGSDPERCFTLRTMLIHHYRRILLKDPDLPAPLLPEQWAGHQAQQLCAVIYRAIEAPSEEYILSVGENRQGPFRKLQPKFRRRFAAEG